MARRESARGRAFARSVARTAVFNVFATAALGVAGIVIARTLGSTVRGEYAAIMAWFGTVLVVGELGQTAATTYFVARSPERGPRYLATSRVMMILTGLAVLSVGIGCASLLSAGNDAVADGYRMVFATCLAAFVGASYTSSLLAVNLLRWNVVRVSQPVLFGVTVIGLHHLGQLSLTTILLALSATIILQSALAYVFCATERLTGGRADRALVRPMTRFGLSHLAASVPALLISRLDQLVLSVTVAPAVLGQYAVASSITTLVVPIVSAVGSAAFPKLASRTLSVSDHARLQRHALWGSAAFATAMMAGIAGTATWLVPAVFGAGFHGAVTLVWLLAPAGVFLACGQVCGDLLRGQGRPIAVARAQGIAAVVTVLALIALLPTMGTSGAAVATSAAALVALAHMLRTLRRRPAEALPATTPPSRLAPVDGAIRN